MEMDKKDSNLSFAIVLICFTAAKEPSAVGD